MGKSLVPAGKVKPWEHSTKKEQLFVDHYMANGFSAVEAFISAGYSTVSRRPALRANAHQVLRRPHVKAEIDRRMRQLQMTEDEALARHSEVGRADIGECLVDSEIKCPVCGAVIAEEGAMRVDLKKLKQMGLTHLLKRVTTYKDGRTTVDFYESDKARQDLLRASGAFRGKGEETALNLMGLMAEAAAAKRKMESGEIDADFEVSDGEASEPE